MNHCQAIFFADFIFIRTNGLDILLIKHDVIGVTFTIGLPALAMTNGVGGFFYQSRQLRLGFGDVYLLSVLLSGD